MFFIVFHLSESEFFLFFCRFQLVKTYLDCLYCPLSLVPLQVVAVLQLCAFFVFYFIPFSLFLFLF